MWITCNKVLMLSTYNYVDNAKIKSIELNKNPKIIKYFCVTPLWFFKIKIQ